MSRAAIGPLSLVLVQLVASALFAHGARAQSAAVREGQRLFDEAEFEQAIEVLERGLAAETLSRAEVAIALDRLAIAHHALGHEVDVQRALRWLVIVDRDHRFGPDAPPELASLTARTAASTRPELRLSVVDEEHDRVTLEATFEGPDDLRAIELGCRTAGESVRTIRDRRPRMTVPRAASCDAIAIGPGAFPVATAHREGTIEMIPTTAAGSAGGVADEVWIGLAAGGGALVIGAIVIAIVTTQSAGGPVQVSAPTVTGPGWSL